MKGLKVRVFSKEEVATVTTVQRCSEEEEN
jgi:hypothetical protein